MSVRFTGENIYIQFVDDFNRRTVAATSTLSKSVEGRDKISANVTGAQKMGKISAEVAKSKGIEHVVFDRSGARYHGKVKALADAAREGGLKF